jgi:hypothetical protein
MLPRRWLFVTILLSILDCGGDGVDIVPTQTSAPPVVVYLNFSDGADSIRLADGDNAATNESRLCMTPQVPAWNGAPSCGGRESCRRAVADMTQRYWLPFNLVFTTRRPSAAPYSMVMIGAPSGHCAFGVVGLAMLDCGNVVSTDIAFTFSCLEPKECARIVSQELGHALGLTHTTHPCDLMSQDAKTCGEPLFVDEDMPSEQGELGCGLAKQNSFRMLIGTLGAWDNARSKPVDW